MKDVELLELAAKAAGLWENNAGNKSGWECNYPLGWNPLENDDDALRLAVKCKLSPPYFNWDTEVVGYIGTNPYAATRRAIVRAAAEIGKWMSLKQSVVA